MSMNQGRRLYRSTRNRMIAGVAGGIAEYLGVDPTLVRVAWVALGLIIVPTAPMLLLLYIVLAIIVPQEPMM